MAPIDPLARFSPLTREWFMATFTAPTAAQAEAWDAIAGGKNTLVIAPTGSGKTLAAFLWAIDQLAAAEPRPPKAGTRVLYISPLKALAVDVERNLSTQRSLVVGISVVLDLPESVPGGRGPRRCFQTSEMGSGLSCQRSVRRCRACRVDASQSHAPLSSGDEVDWLSSVSMAR